LYNIAEEQRFYFFKWRKPKFIHAHLLLTSFFKPLQTLPSPPCPKHLLLQEPYLIAQNHTGHLFICSTTTLGLVGCISPLSLRAGNITHTHTHTHTLLVATSTKLARFCR